jgi:hypothetical protein
MDKPQKLKFPHPAVFIFGAGATMGSLIDTSDIAPPVDNNFFSIAGRVPSHGTPQLANRVLKNVWDLYGEVYGVGLERYYSDIETRCRIGKCIKQPHKKMDWEKRKADLVELIRRVYVFTTSYLEKNMVMPRLSDAHSNILKYLKRNDAILTFNYDLLIEESFGEKSIWNPIDGYGFHIPGKTTIWCRKWIEKHRPKKSSLIELIKLHGSINWALYKNRAVKFKPKPYFSRMKQNKVHHEKICILPPGWDKGFDKNPYKALWEKAHDYLYNCKSLVIIGYSLPETDLTAHALFAEVVRQRVQQNNRITELHIVDPSKVIQDKFISLFEPIIKNSGKIYVYNSINEYAGKGDMKEDVAVKEKSN